MQIGLKQTLSKTKQLQNPRMNFKAILQTNDIADAFTNFYEFSKTSEDHTAALYQKPTDSKLGTYFVVSNNGEKKDLDNAVKSLKDNNTGINPLIKSTNEIANLALLFLRSKDAKLIPDSDSWNKLFAVATNVSSDSKDLFGKTKSKTKLKIEKGFVPKINPQAKIKNIGPAFKYFHNYSKYDNEKKSGLYYDVNSNEYCIAYNIGEKQNLNDIVKSFKIKNTGIQPLIKTKGEIIEIANLIKDLKDANLLPDTDDFNGLVNVAKNVAD